MTVEQAIRAADGMRPNNPYAPETKYRWLRECDALIRTQVVVKSATGDYEGVGADYAGEEMDELTELLAPAPYALLNGFAVWMRQTYMPAKQTKLRY